MTKQFDPEYVNAFMNAWENGIIATALKDREQVSQPSQDYYYSNFQSLIIGKDKFAKELQMAEKASD